MRVDISEASIPDRCQDGPDFWCGYAAEFADNVGRELRKVFSQKLDRRGSRRRFIVWGQPQISKDDLVVKIRMFH